MVETLPPLSSIVEYAKIVQQFLPIFNDRCFLNYTVETEYYSWGHDYELQNIILLLCKYLLIYVISLSL